MASGSQQIYSDLVINLLTMLKLSIVRLVLIVFQHFKHALPLCFQLLHLCKFAYEQNSQFAITIVYRVSTHGHLEFMGQTNEVGVYTEKPFLHMTYIHVIEAQDCMWWALTQRLALTQDTSRY